MTPIVRALLDANLFISYLLSWSRGASVMGAILAAAASRGFTLLLADQLAGKSQDTIAERLDLRRRIPRPTARNCSLV